MQWRRLSCAATVSANKSKSEARMHRCSFALTALWWWCVAVGGRPWGTDESWCRRLWSWPCWCCPHPLRPLPAQTGQGWNGTGYKNKLYLSCRKLPDIQIRPTVDAVTVSIDKYQRTWATFQPKVPGHLLLYFQETKRFLQPVVSCTSTAV